MLSIWFIRHGQTDYNLNMIIQGGGVDSDLNRTGRQQAINFFERYRKIEFDAFVASSLKRTQQTIAPFTDYFDSRPYFKLPELNEMNWGKFEGQKASPEMHEEYKRLNREWGHGNLDIATPGGESPQTCWDRSLRGLEQLKREMPEGRILVCSHGRLLRVILSQLLGYGMEKMNWFPHENTALNVIHWHKSGKCYAEKLNDLSHLN